MRKCTDIDVMCTVCMYLMCILQDTSISIHIHIHIHIHLCMYIIIGIRVEPQPAEKGGLWTPKAPWPCSVIHASIAHTPKQMHRHTHVSVDMCLCVCPHTHRDTHTYAYASKRYASKLIACIRRWFGGLAGYAGASVSDHISGERVRRRSRGPRVASWWCWFAWSGRSASTLGGGGRQPQFGFNLRAAGLYAGLAAPPISLVALCLHFFLLRLC